MAVGELRADNRRRFPGCARPLRNLRRRAALASSLSTYRLLAGGACSREVRFRRRRCLVLRDGDQGMDGISVRSASSQLLRERRRRSELETEAAAHELGHDLSVHSPSSGHSGCRSRPVRGGQPEPDAQLVSSVDRRWREQLGGLASAASRRWPARIRLHEQQHLVAARGSAWLEEQSAGTGLALSNDRRWPQLDACSDGPAPRNRGRLPQVL